LKKLNILFSSAGLVDSITDLVIISDVDDEQRKRLEFFLNQKKLLGELNSEDDFEKLSELGDVLPAHNSAVDPDPVGEAPFCLIWIGIRGPPIPFRDWHSLLTLTCFWAS
jgi:hypothetical protein